MQNQRVGKTYQHILYPKRQVQVLDVFMIRHTPVARVKYLSTSSGKNIGLTSTITMYYLEEFYNRISFDNQQAQWEV